MGDTNIEWADAVWNPIVGCTRVSPGCQNCYAERMARRLIAMGQKAYEGTVDKNGHWTGVVNVNWAKMNEPLGRKKPTVYFVNSMSDVFHENVEDITILEILKVCQAAPHHRFIVLTKRADRMRDFFRRYVMPPSNVILGVSVENQKTADERIPDLMATPAATRCISAEPLLGNIRLIAPDAKNPVYSYPDWVILGGESGPKGRPMHPDWARSLRDQCIEGQVPFFFKQWGEWTCVYDRDVEDPDWQRCPKSNGHHERYVNIEGGHGFHNDRVVFMRWVGKKNAGNMLDGETWAQFPQAIGEIRKGHS